MSNEKFMYFILAYIWGIGIIVGNLTEIDMIQEFKVIGAYIPHNGKLALYMEYTANASNKDALAMEIKSYGQVLFFNIFNSMGEPVYRYG